MNCWSSKINGIEAKNRDIAMVFQNLRFILWRLPNMGFSLRLMKRSKTDMGAAVKNVAEVLGIGELLDRLQSNCRRPAAESCHGSGNRSPAEGLSV